ncbi:MAG: PQQ-binding-like beta-propeller repeat protein, partial [Acidimicrobiales bacterium]|nr:PQQ-binding-like beta-propeller repeat protein [Acidimicrobiales bacterium]
MLGRVALAVALLIVSGCFWQVPGADSNRSAHNPFERRITADTVTGLEQRWEATLDGGPVGDPVTSALGVHVDGERSIYSFDARTGAERWQYSSESITAAGQPWVWRDHVLANVYDGGRAVVELDPVTGAETGRIPGQYLSGLRQDTAALVSTERRCIRFCFNLDTLTVENLHTGQVLFSGDFNTGGALPQVTVGSEWVVHGGVGMLLDNIFEPAEGVRGYSISAPRLDCSLVAVINLCPDWSVALSESYPPVLSEDGSVVYAGATAYDTATGELLWTPSVSDVAGPSALAEGTLFSAGRHERLLRAFPAGGCSASTCEPLWSGELGFEPDPVLQPAVAGDVVFVAG